MDGRGDGDEWMEEVMDDEWMEEVMGMDAFESLRRLVASA